MNKTNLNPFNVTTNRYICTQYRLLYFYIDFSVFNAKLIVNNGQPIFATCLCLFISAVLSAHECKLAPLTLPNQQHTREPALVIIL